MAAKKVPDPLWLRGLAFVVHRDAYQHYPGGATQQPRPVVRRHSVKAVHTEDDAGDHGPERSRSVGTGGVGDHHR